MSTYKKKTDFAFLSTAEAATYLGVTPGRIRQLLMRGQIHGNKIGQRGWAIAISELDKRKS